MPIWTNFGIHASSHTVVVPPPDPSGMAGLIGWYDASYAPSVISAGGLVSQWSDRSPSAKHITQPTGASQPQTGVGNMNGHNVVTFPTTGRYLFNNAYGQPFSPFPTGLTIVSVFRCSNPANAYGPAAFNTSWQGAPTYRIADQAVFGTDSPAGFDATIYDGAAVCQAFRCDVPANFNISAQGRVDGVNGTMHSAMPYAWDDSAGKWFSFGMRSDGAAHFTGDVALVLIFTRWVPDAELVPLEAQIRNYWGTP